MSQRNPGIGLGLSSRYTRANENFVLVLGSHAAALRPTLCRSASRSSQMRW